MKRTMIVWTLLLVAAMPLVGVAAVYAQGGQGSLVVVNYVGKSMSFTLDGTLYTVPAADGSKPGETTFTLAPGKHDYSGAIPGGPGASASVDLAAGQTYVLGARLDKTAARISSEGKVLEEPRDILVFFPASLTPPAAAAAPKVALQKLPAGQGALVFDNYIGEELVLDIQGAKYRVPADGRLQVNLAPGEYSYSASAGISGTSGSASVTAGQYTGLGFSLQIMPTPEYEEGEPKPTVEIPKIYVASVDQSGEVVAEATPGS